MVDAAFKGVGKNPGLDIWRIEVSSSNLPRCSVVDLLLLKRLCFCYFFAFVCVFAENESGSSGEEILWEIPHRRFLHRLAGDHHLSLYRVKSLSVSIVVQWALE